MRGCFAPYGPPSGHQRNKGGSIFLVRSQTFLIDVFCVFHPYCHPAPPTELPLPALFSIRMDLASSVRYSKSLHRTKADDRATTVRVTFRGVGALSGTPTGGLETPCYSVIKCPPTTEHIQTVFSPH
ncbi:unnamed protein product [Pleuronectes platessa]|uniref:Uncharacterized protein n=1 Tax=Pleuronectes platessa TaxID=8262 RepID=A0A9N7Z7E5_PLEPL|nr:unnamed protein product [Pleuronectes platessa]